MYPLSVGYGAGSRELQGMANVVRALVGNKSDIDGNIDFGCAQDIKPDSEINLSVEQCVLLETNIDHLSPEAMAFACEELLRCDLGATICDGLNAASAAADSEAAASNASGVAASEAAASNASAVADSEAVASNGFVATDKAASAAAKGATGGALDVWQEPIVMKKGRAAWKLCVLVRPGQANAATQSIIRLTATLGVRRRLVERAITPRDIIHIETEFGSVRFKSCLANNPPENWLRPEHDDVARIARERGLPYDDVRRRLHDAALHAIVKS
jgi:uncharacterized protein (DUF111 family)